MSTSEFQIGSDIYRGMLREALVVVTIEQSSWPELDVALRYTISSCLWTMLVQLLASEPLHRMVDA